MDANQSRRRTDPASAANIDYLPAPAASRAFSYQPLDPEIDCTRLVEIEPAQSDDDPVVCKLHHVAFSARPKYEALSYMVCSVSL